MQKTEYHSQKLLGNAISVNGEVAFGEKCRMELGQVMINHKDFGAISSTIVQSK